MVQQGDHYLLLPKMVSLFQVLAIGENMMCASNIDLNEMQNNENDTNVCPGEERLNFMRHVWEASSQRLSGSRYKVASDELHSVGARQRVLLEILRAAVSDADSVLQTRGVLGSWQITPAIDELPSSCRAQRRGQPESKGKLSSSLACPN